MTPAKKHPAAVALGRLGGRVTSAKKAAASRANGRKGGRPRDLTWCRRCYAKGVSTQPEPFVETLGGYAPRPVCASCHTDLLVGRE